MLNFKKVLLFLFSFIVIFIVLNLAVPMLGIEKWSNTQVVKIGNKLYGKYKGKARVSFTKQKPNKKAFFEHPFKEYDDLVVTKIMSEAQIAEATRRARAAKTNQITVNHAEYVTNIWQYIWIPLMLVMSLILATPIPIKRRLFSLLLGIVVTTIFIFAKFHIRFVVEINRHGWLDLGSQGTFAKKMFVYMNTFLLYMGASLIAAVIIWAIVTFRKGDHLLFMKPVEIDEEELVAAEIED